MRITLLAVIASMLSSATAIAQSPSRDVQFDMPAQFIGEWNAKLDDCGTGNNDSRLRISKTDLRFYENGGPVKAVVRRGAFEIMVVVELAGEGQSWLAAHRFILNADGSYLNSPADDGSRFVRYRCPSVKIR